MAPAKKGAQDINPDRCVLDARAEREQIVTAQDKGHFIGEASQLHHEQKRLVRWN